MRVRITEPELWTIRGQNIKLSETGRVMREQNSESVKAESTLGSAEQFERYLMEPFLVHMKAGVVESLFVGKNEPVSVTNIKKSILSQIQMDIAGTHRTQLETNHITGCPGYDCVSKAESTIAGCPGYDCVSTVSKFKTKEASVQGECQTQYSVQKLPQWKINQLEEAWRLEELKVKDFNVDTESEAMKLCQDKPYYLITKTKSLEQCKKTPFFQMYTRDTVAIADLTSNTELGTIVSTTSIYACGELNDFVVRKVAHKRTAAQTITGYNTEEFAV